MFLRLVQAKVKPGRVGDLSAAYGREIIPKLQEVDGCLFVSLVQNERQPGECVSLTLWETAESAEDYVRKGTYARLLEIIMPYLSGTTEWKVHLSPDQKLEYVPVTEEPAVKAYNVSPVSPASPPSENPGPLYVRILSLRFRPGKMEEFKDLYMRRILPVLNVTKGCRYAYLTEEANERDEVISMTIWDSKEFADEYESSGTFNALVHQIGHLLSGLYQWKMSLENEPGRSAVTSEDISVEGYSVVTGKSFL